MRFLKTFLDTFSKIRTRTIESAQEIGHEGARAAAREMLAELEACSDYTPEWYEERARIITERILSARPAQAHLLNSLEFLFPHHPASREEAEDLIKKRYVLMERHHAIVFQNIRHHALHELSHYHLAYTHGHSSSAITAIVAANIKKAYVTETRPYYEGRRAADDLLAEGVEVHFRVDSAMIECVRACDVIVLGSERITQRGDSYNSVGSRLIGMLAKRYRKPLYVISDSFKLERVKTHTHAGEAGDVWDTQREDLHIKNVLSEKIPAHQIHRFISETGVHTPEDFVATAHAVLDYGR